MTKSEAEALIRRVVHDWARGNERNSHSDDMPSFADFKDWLTSQWPDALSFRSVMGADEDAERWFDDELRQNWRN